MRHWIDRYQNKRNLYFSVNRTKPGLRSKATKADITEMVALHVDVDPPKTPGIDLAAAQAAILDKLKAHNPPPSAIVFSGGGYQPFWRLDVPEPLTRTIWRNAEHDEPVTPIGEPEAWSDGRRYQRIAESTTSVPADELVTSNRVAELEAYNIALERALGGDHCHNIDRIMRIPGTINIPDKKKRQAGRVPALAKLIYFNADLAYELSDFPPVPPPPGGGARRGSDGGASDGHTGDGEFPPPLWLGELIRKPDYTKFGGNRSAAVFAAACGMLKEFWSEARIIRTISDPANGISEHILDEKDSPRAARRALEHVRKRLAEERVQQQGTSFRDPWAAPPQPQWPPDVLPVLYHDMIHELAHTSGTDPGALGMAALAAVSGAAPKSFIFLPKGEDTETGWKVRPILWVMIDAPSGQRKTALNVVFSALERKNAKVWGEYQIALGDWLALSKEDRDETEKPREPHSYVVQDITPEKLCHILAAMVSTNRGTLLRRDELAGFFGGFGRYNNDKGASERAFYLQAYDGGSFTVHRATRDPIFISECGTAIFGHIQPERLAEFRNLASDGLLPRFVAILAGRATVGKPLPGKIRGKAEFDTAITRLAELGGGLFERAYRPQADATVEIISKLEADAVALTELTDYGAGFQGFCGRLHGTCARIAFLLQAARIS
jgi:hypothetical protein